MIATVHRHEWDQYRVLIFTETKVSTGPPLKELKQTVVFHGQGADQFANEYATWLNGKKKK